MRNHLARTDHLHTLWLETNGVRSVARVYAQLRRDGHDARRVSLEAKRQTARRHRADDDGAAEIGRDDHVTRREIDDERIGNVVGDRAPDDEWRGVQFEQILTLSGDDGA